MQKIHRRRNQDILKDYVCSQGCGKTYGSYAALYTHVKNKHPNSKPPQMKAGTIFKMQKEEKRPNRYAEKSKDNEIPILFTYDCRLCKKVECICSQNINFEELQRSVILLSDQTFIKFIKSIGHFQENEKLNYVRSTQLPHQFLSRQKIREMVYEFNQKHEHLNQQQVFLSNKWVQYLSYSSYFWSPQFYTELYTCIFIIMTKENVSEIEHVIENSPEFQCMKKIVATKRKQWVQFADFVKAV